ncbi:MAG: hypothetical protein IJ526_04090 [Lachnospiraceae bacterium]|nr:hypothetical protein [Lachnospiraceae bacterium]
MRGGITVFLTLILSVLSGFIIALTGLTKRYIAKSEAVYAVDNAVRSCFAEYNRELFDRYHILLIDSSYKGYEKGRDRIADHFTLYLENGIYSNELCYVQIPDAGSVSEMNCEYLYESGVGYAKEVTGIDERLSGKDDDAYFLSYILNVCQDEGDIEYLLYESDSDEENLRLASVDYESCAENEEMTYDLYLCNRLEAEEIMLLRRRFARRLTKHMHINGSPGFDLNECYYKVTFTATLKSRNLGEYSVEREYAYNTKI